MILPPLSLNAWLRFDVVERVLRSLDDVGSVLEIGAGEGAVGARLAQRYSYVGVEPDARSFETACRRLERAGRGTVVRDIASLPEGRTFDLVCAFEVLEHIEDDSSALTEWRGRIRPGGWLLISVPAFERRFGAADERVGHHRRYDPERLRALLASSRFSRPRLLMYGFPLGIALEWGRNLIAGRAARLEPIHDRSALSGRWLQPPGALGWTTWAASLLPRLAQRPFVHTRRGTGIIALVRRPGP